MIMFMFLTSKFKFSETLSKFYSIWKTATFLSEQSHIQKRLIPSPDLILWALRSMSWAKVALLNLSRVFNSVFLLLDWLLYYG